MNRSSTKPDQTASRKQCHMIASRLSVKF